MLLFGVNPDNAAERVLYHDKHNVSPKSSTQVYVVEPATVLDDDGQVMPTARLVYLRDETSTRKRFSVARRARREH
jgi:hypothetical protein